MLQRQVKNLGKVKAKRIASVSKDGLTKAQANAVSPDLRPIVDLWLLTNNPMRDRVFRNTRTTMRAYRDAGLLPPEATIPDREVTDEFIRWWDLLAEDEQVRVDPSAIAHKKRGAPEARSSDPQTPRKQQRGQYVDIRV